MPDVPTFQNLELVFTNVVKAAVALAGIVLFVVLLMGGINFLTSGGDPKKVEVAQKTITTGLGGLILVLLSYMILVLIRTITGVDVTQFRVTQ
jgi:hypothetical protein